MPTTLSRLQDNLRLGITCVQEIWRDEQIKDWVTGVHAADIDQDGDIEVLASSGDGRVRALTRDGRLRWDRIIGDKTWVTAVAACAPVSDTLPACVIASTRDGKIYVLDQDGRELPPDPEKPEIRYWFNAKSSISQMSILTLQPLTVVFAADNYQTYALNISTNQLLWSFSARDQIRAIFPYDIDGDGEMETLVGSDDQHLYILSSQGSLLASTRLDQAIYSLFVSDLDGDGLIEILAGTRTKMLYALTLTRRQEYVFTPKWEQKMSSRALALSVANVNSERQMAILVACDDQSLVILDSVGKTIWREKLEARFNSLNAFDLDLDGHTEVLAGTDNSQVHALRIQLSKGLEKKIRRDYAALGKPDVSTLLELTGEQRNLLIGVLGTSDRGIDKRINLATAQHLQETGRTLEALLMLLKLGEQKFQLHWENNQLGYRRVLCLADITGDTRQEVVVGSPEHGLLAFNHKGRLLWSETIPQKQIIDVQSGHITQGHGEDLAFISSSGSFWLMKPEKALGQARMQLTTPLECPEPISCFYVLAPPYPSPTEVLIGTHSGKVYLYRNEFQEPAHLFQLPTAIDRVYVTERDKSGSVRDPELLISTTENQLFAYTRGGNCPWIYETRSRILALCSRDLDNDGRLEVLIGSEDRNIYLLDDTGKLRWRYVLFHNVLALDTADIDGDGRLEILVGCADGILYVFTSVGDLIWRYNTSDRIQALRVADIDRDGNFEITMVEESHLEVLQVINQHELNSLLTTCWHDLFAQRDPFAALLPLTRDNDPVLRAAALSQMALLKPLPPIVFDLFDQARNDTFDYVRKILPEALMHAFPADPARARVILNEVSRDRSRVVRIEVLEHLQILAQHDWPSVIIYLDRAVRSSERITRRAGLRKVSHLLQQYSEVIKASQSTLGESLFKVLLTAFQEGDSLWVKDEAGRVLADFLNLFERDCLVYFHRLLTPQTQAEPLQFVAYNLASPIIQRILANLHTVIFHFRLTTVLDELTIIVQALERVYERPYGTEMWLIFRELQELVRQSQTIESLAAYEFRLKAEQFPSTSISYPHTQTFLRLGEHLTSIIRPLHLSQHRTDPNDRLDALSESIRALNAFQRQVEREYGANPLPNTPQPLLPEFIVLKALATRWQELFASQLDELHGHAELVCDLQPRVVHLEETVGVWLQITNQGRAPAKHVKITLLSDESFTTIQQTFETELIAANQEIRAEFLIQPLLDSITLTFEILYDDVEHEAYREIYQEHLEVIEWQREFTEINNPYATGTPVQDSSMFYGREADLAYLKDNLTRTTAQTVLVLYGQRRSGKTTLLYQLVNSSMPTGHVPVMIDLQGIYDFSIENLLFKVAYEIYQAMKRRDLPLARPLKAEFVEGSRPDPIFAFDCFLDEVQDVLRPRHQKLILLLDEFELLEEQVNKGVLKPEIFSYLRSLMQKRQYMHFLLSGTHHIEWLTHDYWSVFFNIALHYRLPGRISVRGAEALITEPVLGSLEYDQLAVTKIRQLTADQPYLIQLVCRYLVDHCNQKRKNYATINDVNLVLNEVIESGGFHFAWLLKQIKRPQQILLQAIAEGSQDGGRQLGLDDIQTIYRQYQLRYQRDDVLSSLNKLWAEDIIETTGNKQQGGLSDDTRYTLTIGLLHRWLKKNRSLSSFLPETEKQLLSSNDKSEDFLLGAIEQMENNWSVDNPANGSHAHNDPSLEWSGAEPRAS
jgi:outer membrane protein assembly factor BamB